jgi:hypothetical protein
MTTNKARTPSPPFTVTYTHSCTLAADNGRYAETITRRETDVDESYVVVRLTLPVALLRVLPREHHTTMIATETEIVFGQLLARGGDPGTRREHAVVVIPCFGQVETMIARCEFVHGFRTHSVAFSDDVFHAPLALIQRRDDWNEAARQSAEDALYVYLGKQVFNTLYREINGSHASVPDDLTGAARQDADDALSEYRGKRDVLGSVRANR